MAGLRLLSGMLAVVGCLLTPAMAEAKGAKGCSDLHDACMAAGFSPAADGLAGNKILRDCIKPLIDGETPPGKGRRALPTVAPDAIASCKAEMGDGSDTSKAAKAAAVDGEQAGGAKPVPAKPLPAGTKPGPNIVMILTDDFSLDLMSSKNGVLAESMPNLAQMMKEGASFSNYFVTDSLCCPSRTSIFTGMLPHNSGVISNVGADGGYDAFMSNKDDAKTFALSLRDAFYQTAMMGKFLNGYKESRNGVPQGWSEWAVASNGYPNYGYVLNENGVLRAPKPHLTDEISQIGQDFMTKAAAGPFFLELATFSPHGPYTPPERYADAFPGLKYPRGPAFGARPDANAPQWLQIMPELSEKEMRKFDQVYRKRVQSDKGVDDMIGAVRKKLADLGLTENTYVIFTSDNGYHMGEYSLGTGKMTPFDTDIRVPLVVVGPGIAAGTTISDIAMNIDLAPTFNEIAGVAPLPTYDGHSLLGLFQGKAGPVRTFAIVEHQRTDPSADDPDTEVKSANEAAPGNPPTYVALRMKDALYVEYAGNPAEISYYDLKSDPYALHNIAGSLSADKLKALHAALLAGHGCAGSKACGAAMALTP